MRGKHKKLQEWMKAGLLSEDQAQAIQSYENSKKAGRFGRGLIGLAIFAILVGVLSIIASNWALIPGDVKIGIHVLINILVGVAAYQSAKSGKDIWREGLTLGLFGLTLTLIALTGQVYQLDGETATALTLWMAITLPLMLTFGASYITVAPWMVAFLTTLIYALLYYGEGLSDYNQGLLLGGFGILLPLAMMAKGSVQVCRNWKPVWADVFLKTGIVLLALSASCSAVTMGIDRSYEMDAELKKEFYSMVDSLRLICLAGFGGIFLHAAFHKFYRHDEHMKLGGIFAAVSLALMSLPIVIIELHSEIGAAALFIGYWGFIGWLGQQLGQSRLITLAIVVIAFRILIIYFELFSTLMDTGILLIGGGVLVLAVIWAARRMNTRLTKKGGAV